LTHCGGDDVIISFPNGDWPRTDGLEVITAANADHLVLLAELDSKNQSRNSIALSSDSVFLAAGGSTGVWHSNLDDCASVWVWRVGDNRLFASESSNKTSRVSRLEFMAESHLLLITEAPDLYRQEENSVVVMW
jgi:hypothetical protein